MQRCSSLVGSEDSGKERVVRDTSLDKARGLRPVRDAQPSHVRMSRVPRPRRVPGGFLRSPTLQTAGIDRVTNTHGRPMWLCRAPADTIRGVPVRHEKGPSSSPATS